MTTFWRESETGPPRRYYQLTDGGRQALAGFTEEWARFRDGVDALLDGGGNTMTTLHTNKLVADYLRRLEQAAAPLTRSRRAELLAEIREHIDDALLEARRSR